MESSKKKARGKSRKLTRTDKLIIHVKCHPGFHPVIKTILVFPFIMQRLKLCFTDRRKRPGTISAVSLFSLLIIFNAIILYTISDKPGTYETAFAADSGLFTVGYVYTPTVAPVEIAGNSSEPVTTADNNEPLVSATPIPSPVQDPSIITINSAASLIEFATRVNSGECDLNAIMLADIEIDSSLGYWTPIADFASNTDLSFSGNFDGNGYTISGLRSAPASSHRGLFGCVSEEGTVRNLIIKDCELYGTEYIGGIAAENYGTILNCYVSGSISADENGILLGGITGVNNGKIEDSTNNCHINGGGYVGGIAGENHNTIISCTNLNHISGEISVGGIAGQNEAGHIQDCTCQTTAAIEGDTGIGGIVGINSDDSTTINSSSLISPAGTAGVGNIVGINYGQITECYKITEEGTYSYDPSLLCGYDYGNIN